VKHFLQRVDTKSSSFYKSLLYGETVIQDDMDLTDLVEKNVVLTLVTIPYVRGSEQQLLSYSRRGHVTKVQEVYESAGFPQDPDVTDGLGRTPLYMAASRGHWEIVRLLCDKSASLDRACTHHQRTALCIAARRGHSPVIQVLCEAGANKNQPDIWGASPLLHACRAGHFHSARMLCQARANVDQGDLGGQTPLSVCSFEDRHLLIGAGEADSAGQTKTFGQSIIACEVQHLNSPRRPQSRTMRCKRWLCCRHYALRTALGAFQFSRAA